jgi:TolA-binding protein
VRELREENAQLARRLESLSAAVDAVQARSRSTAAAPKDGGVVPPDLAVVRIAPPAPAAPAPAARPHRAPPVPTSVAISEPDANRVESLSHSAHGLATEAEAELGHARAHTGTERARLLEEFVQRYPRHPQADNALVEASSAWAEAGLETEACALARRVSEEYPAGDALPDALERQAWCEQRQGARGAERRLLERLANEFPRTPAGQRAETRLATISGRTGGTPDGSARSGP